LVFSADGDYLKLRVSDKDNPFPIPFGERSRGFQWFFSFYLVFLVESEKAHKDAILLLDEPGLHLHPTLQEKLIGLFERISKENQLLYSTHLPFLIDGDHFERIRTVYLSNSEPPKTLVSNELRPAGDRATLFPLQAALGYSIAQTLFIGKSTLIVEGISDFWMLKALDARLSSLGDQDTLNKDIVLIPAGGTSRLMPLASIMLASMSEAKGRLLVLLDSDTEGEQAASRLEKNFDHEAPVVMLGAALGMEFATIEDLVPRPQYAAALKKVLGRTFTLDAKENAAPTNVKAIGLLFHRKGWGELTIDQKAAVALELIAEWGNDPSSVLTETLDLARKLFRELNQRFSG
jgi:predicted ATP-dependent endonuclease of OLD family